MKQSKINALSEPWLLGFHVLAPTTECSRGICSSCSLLTCPECRTGGLRQPQSHGENPGWTPGVHLHALVSCHKLVLLFCKDEFKAKPAGSRVVTPLQGKIMGQKQPCGPSPPMLGCPALQSLPSQLLGQQSPTHLMLGHSAALLPSSRRSVLLPLGAWKETLSCWSLLQPWCKAGTRCRSAADAFRNFRKHF